MPSGKLTIVHVLGSFEIGGAEQVALNLAAGQVRRGHVVHVVSLSGNANGPNARQFENAGVTVHRVPKRGPTIDPSLPFRLAALFRSLGVNIVHSHNPQPIVYCGPAARLARIPLVHTKHGANPATNRSAWLRRVTSRMADVLVAVSEQTAREASEQGEVMPGRLQVIENGIDLGDFAPNAQYRKEFRDQYNIPREALVAGTVGRLAEIKNQPLLIRAVAPLLSEQFRLVIVGEGPHRSVIEEEAQRTPHPGFVHLTGQRLDVSAILPAFDIFCLTSDSEGLPMVIPEAMACQLPVVSTAVGGIPDVVQEGVTGRLVPKGDVVALRGAIQELSERSDLRQQMGLKGQDCAQGRYSTEVMVGKYERVYGGLVGRECGLS